MRTNNSVAFRQKRGIKVMKICPNKRNNIVHTTPTKFIKVMGPQELKDKRIQGHQFLRQFQKHGLIEDDQISHF